MSDSYTSHEDRAHDLANRVTALELMNAELVYALEDCVEELDEYGPQQVGNLLSRARAAIAKEKEST